MKSLTQTMIVIGAVLYILGAPAYAQEHQHSAEPESDEKLWWQAEQFYDPQEMRAARAQAMHHSGAQNNWFVMADRLETQFNDGEKTLLWDGNAWYGGDVNKLWIKSEGEYSFEENGFEDAEVQALWSRAISPYFDLQTGVRYDFEPEGRFHGVFGAQGLAPYWFEIDAAGFISDEGDLTARIEAEYELLLTQRLILQPRAEAEFSAQDIPEFQTGSGLTSLDAGLRIRYEIKREIAPYIGVEWRGSFGDTADYIRADGGDPKDTYFVAGLRLWF